MNDDDPWQDKNELLERILNRKKTGIDPITGRPLRESTHGMRESDHSLNMDQMEDTMRYDLYFMDSRSNDASMHREHAMQFLHDAVPALAHYIWQSEPFALHVTNEKSEEEEKLATHCAHLSGTTHFGENIEDEWFIVFLLRRLTEQFDNLIVRVEDTDGQFLLIEAAMVIPDWIQPQNSQNRVFLHRGKVHIIPRPMTPSHIQRIPVGAISDVNVALKLVWESHIETDYAFDTEADLAVTEVINRRLAKYPKQVLAYQHTVRCFLPLPIALLLKYDRGLVARPVRHFFERDPMAMRDCSKMDKFNPEKYPSSMTMVTFTRPLYAMLSQQQFGAPKTFQRAWMSGNGDRHHESNAVELGIKLSSGFEMAYQASRRFGGRGEHAFYHIVDSLLEEIGGDKLNDAESFDSEIVLRDDDSDAWMMDPKHIDREFEAHAEYMTAGNSQERAQSKKNSKMSHEEYSAKAKEIVSGLRNFVEGVSSFEGAEPLHGTTTQEKDELNVITSKILNGETRGLDAFLQNSKSYEEYERYFESMGEKERGDDDDDDDNAGNYDMYGSEDPEMMELMRSMDQELKMEMAHVNEQMESEIQKRRRERGKGRADVEEEGEEEFDEMLGENEEYEMIKNLLQSFKAQEGFAGPFSNIMSELGVQLPEDEDEIGE